MLDEILRTLNGILALFDGSHLVNEMRSQKRKHIKQLLKLYLKTKNTIIYRVFHKTFLSWTPYWKMAEYFYYRYLTVLHLDKKR